MQNLSRFWVPAGMVPAWSRMEGALRDASAAMAWALIFSSGDLRDRVINEVKNFSAYSSGG